jgi:uncharacterized protein
MRVFLDANVLFTAAHNPQGKAALLFAIASAGFLQLATSRYALEEARRNLARKYPDCLARLDDFTRALRLAPENDRVPSPAGLPAKDQPIYRAARACQADVLLTGDLNDFGFLMNDRHKAEGLLIQTVATFLDSL